VTSQSGIEPRAHVSLRLVEAFAWPLLILSILLTVADVLMGPWDHDGGYYLLRAAYAADGLRPYIDFGTIYPPMMDLLHAPLVALNFDRIILAIFIPIGWILVNAFVTGILVYTTTRERAYGVIAAALFPLFSMENGGNHLTLEHGIAFFIMLCMIPLVSESRLTPARMAFVGVMAASAVLVKQVGAVAILPIAAAWWIRRDELTRRHFAMFLAGGFSLVLAILAWLSFDVAAIYRSLFVKLGRYTAASPFKSTLLTDEYGRSPQTVWLFYFTIVVAIWLIVRSTKWRWLAVAALAGGIIEIAPRLIRDYPHYNINAWPFIAIILALAAQHGGRNWQSAFRFSIVLYATLAYATVLFAHRFPYDRPLGSPLLTNLYPAGRIIRNVTPDDAVVRQYGAEPILEFLGYRHEEVIDKGDIVFTRWDGSLQYPDPPHRSTTIVIVDTNQDWLPAARAKVKSYGFQQIPGLAPNSPIEIYRYPSAPPKRSAP